METITGVVTNCFTFLGEAVTFMTTNAVCWLAVGFAVVRKGIKTVKGAAKV